MQVEKERIVSLRYTMKDEKGRLLEDFMDKEPTEFLYGSGHILPELESHLAGMQAGEAAALSFALDFGATKTTFHFNVVIDGVRQATEAEMAAGEPERRAEAGDCGPNCVC